MFFAFSGATSNRKRGMPRLSRRPSHWGYCARLSDVRVLREAREVYQTARLLEFFGFNRVENLAQLVFLSPVFGVLELLEGVLGNKTPRAQIAPGSCQCPAPVTRSLDYRAYSIVSSSWLACRAPLAGVQ